jgi:hypothetical protein
MTTQHICRTHGWVSSLTPCQDCLQRPEPRYVPAPGGLIIDTKDGEIVAGGFIGQTRTDLLVYLNRYKRGAA